VLQEVGAGVASSREMCTPRGLKERAVSWAEPDLPRRNEIRRDENNRRVTAHIYHGGRGG